MKQFAIFFAGMLATAGVFAQASDNFNSRPGAALTQVKGSLQSHCWQFTDFNVNNNGWNPGIEGDGAMVSGPGNDPNENTGIRSQMLSLNGDITISFSYMFSSNVTNRRWLNVFLTDGENNIVNQLDSVELTGANGRTMYTYHKKLGAAVHGYRVYLQYRGIGGNNPIAIDQLSFDAPACYNGGCNQSPVAVDDNIKSDNNQQASGWVSKNDYDPDNNSTLTSQLVTNSADGNVVLYSNGYFTFTPNASFHGRSTTFTYTACDNGTPSLCAVPAKVTVKFPEAVASQPVSISDLDATYTNKNVEVKWSAAAAVNSDHFDIQRSTDGNTYKTVGSIKSQGSHDYAFSDDVSRNTVFKNDLYYRLKQVDADGKTSFSKIMVVRVYQSKAVQSMSVTPNASVNDIKLNVKLNQNCYIVMKVTNNGGEEIMRKVVRGNTGANNLTVDGSSQYTTGVYHLEVIVNSKERMTVDLVKG